MRNIQANIFIILIILCPFHCYGEFVINNIKYSFNGPVPYKQVKVVGVASKDITVTDLVIPDKIHYDGEEYEVNSIYERAFENCSNLKGNLTISKSIKKIEERAFNGCDGLTGTLTLENGIEAIQGGAFGYCNFSDDLIIPNSVVSIGPGAFRDCGFDGNLVLPENLTTIESLTFENCKFTGELIIPGKVKRIEGAAFWGCYGFTGELRLPDSIEEIMYGSFRNCTGFTGQLIIPNHARKIYGFEGCSGFTGPLIFPESLEEVGEFSGCTGITSIHINGRVSTIRNSSFENLTNLKTIEINAPVLTIDSGAFNGCVSLESVILPASLTKIGASVFIPSPNLKEVTCYATTPPDCYYDAFKEFDGIDMSQYPIDVPLYVPASAIEQYKSSTGWSRFFQAYPIPGTEISPQDITLSNDEITLFVGEKEKLSAIVSPDNTTNKTIVWKSSDESIAIVSSDGTVTAVSVGTARISATCGTVSATCKLKVNPVTATTIFINVPDMEVYVGDKVMLSAKITPDNTTDKSVIWTCMTPDIATINSQSGELTAIAPGVAKIMAACGTVTDMATITVKPILATSVTISTEDMTLVVGETGTLTATVRPEGTTDKTVTWGSDNDAIATVAADGTVTAVSVGVANITAKCNDVSATCKVTVNPVIASAITLNAQNLTILIGQTEKLTATVLPESTSDKTVTWASDNEAIATVAADGTVTGVSVGVANITAKCGDVSATCKVTVNPVPAATVTINVPDTKIYVGDKLTLSAMVVPDNTTDKTLIWTCSTPEIATINAQTGELTAIAPGEARIKATCGEATGMATVTIIPVPATSVTISTDDITLFVGQTGKLTATVFPENTTDKNIVWESDNDAIATVTSDGTVTAVSIGVTNITATCGDVTSTCKVTVIPRIEAPIDFVRKGNGTSCTFIVMMNLSDAQLAQKGYKFVYGYTDIQGSEHIMTTTNLRYCHTTPEVYNNNGNDFWVYAFLTNDDGTIVCSTRRHLDGRIDIEANARMLSHYLNRLANIYNPENWITATSHGAQITLPCAENAFVTVHAINGTFMFKRNYENGIEIIDEITSSHLVPSIYIVTVSCGDTTTSKKITIR